MPLVGATRGIKGWATSVLALAVGMMLVTAAFGALVGGAGGIFGDLLSSRTFTAQVMKIAMIAFGSLMLVLGLGELGFVPKLLPEVHLPPALVPGGPGENPRTRSILTGMSLAATFGVICTRPTYLALLLYVALLGSAAYGALALAAYGFGLAIPVALGGRLIAVSARSARLVDWLETRAERLRLAQGALLVLLGTTVVAYFWFRYTIPPA